MSVQPQPLVVLPKTLDIQVLAYGSLWTFKLVIRSKQKLLWQAKKNGGATWLVLGQSAGTLQPGVPQAIDVSIDTSTLAAKNYQTTLTFTKEEDASTTVVQEVPVALSVVSVPGINADGSLIEFPPIVGGPPPGKRPAKTFKSIPGPSINLSPDDSQKLEVALPNPFNEEANWKATIQTSTTAADWLSLTRTGGILGPAENQTLLVTANASNLKEGGYYTAILKIVFEASGNKSHTRMIGITAHVGCYSDDGPHCPVVVPPGPLNLGVAQFADGFKLQVTNPTTNNQVDWILDNGGVNWLTANPITGKLNAGDQTQIALSVEQANLHAGSGPHKTDLTITFIDPKKVEHPTPLPVTIVVTV